MAEKILQFKPPHGRMIVNGLGEITNANLTKELYNKLLSMNPAYADQFEEVDAPTPKAAKKEEKTKPTKE